MTEIVTIKEVKRRYWFNIVKTCKQSGMPVVTWCKQNHIAESTFWYWHKQYMNEAVHQAAQSIPEFVELKSPEEPSHRDTVTIEKDGVHVNIDQSVSDELLIKVLRCLSNV